MKNHYDEPMYVNINTPGGEDQGDQIETEIKALCREQPFAVLATQGDGQPYANLISFAISDDLNYLVFSTPTRTRKYNMIVKNNKVSIFIDNRSQQPESINQISGLTITGQASALNKPEEQERWSKTLVEKHSYLDKFVKAPTSSLILVRTIRFFYVRRFQEVYQWIPKNLA